MKRIVRQVGNPSHVEGEREGQSPQSPSAKSPRKKPRFLRENEASAASEIDANRKHPRNTAWYSLEKLEIAEETMLF
jgi:hypothetical protein